MNVICIYIICPFVFSKCMYLCSPQFAVSLQNNGTIYFIYMLSTCISLSLLFSGSLFSCTFLDLDWQFDLGACCFPEHNHFHNMLSYMFSNKLHNLGGPIRNEMGVQLSGSVICWCLLPHKHQMMWSSQLTHRERIFGKIAKVNIYWNEDLIKVIKTQQNL